MFAAPRQVFINAVQLAPRELAALEMGIGARIQPGRYWYDRRCGAWGLEGGPALGVLRAGLPLGGELRADASGGNTGVFINGRELHAMDVAYLRRILGQTIPGRYWLDAQGNCGQEGGPALVNLMLAARQAGLGGGGGAWSHSTKDYGGGSMHVGGDGQGFNYFMGNGVSWSN